MADGTAVTLACRSQTSGPTVATSRMRSSRKSWTSRSCFSWRTTRRGRSGARSRAATSYWATKSSRSIPSFCARTGCESRQHAPETIAALEAACSSPLEQWVQKLSELNISGDQEDQRPSALPRPTSTDGAQQVLLAFLNPGVGGRDHTPVACGWDDRPVEHVRINTDLPAAVPFDDEINEVLPFLAAA